MITRIALAAAALGLAAFALWHPARPLAVQSETPAPAAQPTFTGVDGARRHHRGTQPQTSDDLVVYVAGAVRRPGIYQLHAGARNAQGVALAGGLSAAADAGAVNLAQRAADGDEIYVPLVGETTHSHSAQRRVRHHSTKPPLESIDVNRSDAVELAAVPGIGRAVAQRIVELRRREGGFASLDELLDVAGMTQSRPERARPYLRQP